MFFSDSKILLLLWGLPLCLAFIFLELRIVRGRFSDFTRLRLDDLLSHKWSFKKLVFKSLLLISVMVLLIFSLARPRWDFEWRELKQSGHDIVIALDLSKSMLATDMSPNRLERAKREIIDLLQLLQGDRVSIVAFAGVSFVYTPLTVDYRLVDMFLKQMSVDLIPVQGTEIGEALETSIKALEKASSAETQGKSIILITDGEDQSSSEVLTVAKNAKEKGIKIYTVGIGSEVGAPIPLPEGGFKKDKQGNIVVTKLGESTLQNISAATDAFYVRSSTGTMDLDRIYQDIRASSEGEEGGVVRQKIWKERFQIFLGIALFLLLLEFFLGATKGPRRKKWGKVLSVFAVFILPLLSPPETYASDVKEGEKAFEAKDYEKAAETFLEAEIKNPGETQHVYNRGVSQAFNKQYEEAAQAFQKSARSEDKELAKKSLFNLGNTHVQQGKLEDAVKSYEQALKIKPEADKKSSSSFDEKIQENLQWTQKKIEELKQQEQNKKDQENKDQENKEKEDQEQKDKQDSDSKEENKEDQEDSQNSDKGEDQKEKENQNQKQEEQNQESSEEQKESSEQQEASESEKKEEENTESASESSEKQEQELKKHGAYTKEEAEKLLRTADEEVYGAPPKYSAPSKAPEKDW